MLITQAQLPGEARLHSVRCGKGRITDIAEQLEPHTGETVLPALGGALLPGLQDHHLHIFALGASLTSVDCGRSRIASVDALRNALQRAPGDGWIRAIGYHESIAGDLDRWQLDALVRHRPLRLQHSSGKLWVLNSAALAEIDPPQKALPEGIELEANGRLTGRFYRSDDWLGERLAAIGQRVMPPLGVVSDLLASRGVTGITDTSPDNDGAALMQFDEAMRAGEWRLRVRLMGQLDLPPAGHDLLSVGEHKILLDEDRLPDWDTLVERVERAHRQGRGVAVHCVTPTELVLTLSVLNHCGVHRNDRIEHGSLIPDDVLPLLKTVGVPVITQPGFIAERGARYCRDLHADQLGSLYRCASLLRHAIPLAGSTDAPYGNADPWRAMRAAVHRRHADGVLGAAERLNPEQALALFTGPAEAPGSGPRSLLPGAPADLCLLNRPWSQARQRLKSEDVRATVCAGNVVFDRQGLIGKRRVSAVA
ncbi:MAG: amidohydrolase family protein [Pseudomonadota bacterium]